MSAFSNVEFLTLKIKKRFPSLCEFRGFLRAKITRYLKNRILKRYLGGQRQFCFSHLLIVSYFLASLALKQKTCELEFVSLIARKWLKYKNLADNATFLRLFEYQELIISGLI